MRSAKLWALRLRTLLGIQDDPGSIPAACLDFSPDDSSPLQPSLIRDQIRNVSREASGQLPPLERRGVKECTRRVTHAAKSTTNGHPVNIPCLHVRLLSKRSCTGRGSAMLHHAASCVLSGLSGDGQFPRVALDSQTCAKGKLVRAGRSARDSRVGPTRPAPRRRLKL